MVFMLKKILLKLPVNWRFKSDFSYTCKIVCFNTENYTMMVKEI